MSTGKRNPLDALTVSLDKRCELGLVRNGTIETTRCSLFSEPSSAALRLPISLRSPPVSRVSAVKVGDNELTDCLGGRNLFSHYLSESSACTGD